MKRLFLFVALALVFWLSACQTAEPLITASEPIRTQPINVHEVAIKPQALGATAVTVDSGNLLSNANFDAGLDSWGLCDNSSIAISNDVSAEPFGNYGGDRNKALALSAGDCFYQSVEASAEQEFTLSCYVKVLSGNDWTGMGLSFSDVNWTMISEATPAIMSSTSYQRYDVNGIAPANTSYVSMWLYSDNNVVVDNCSLTFKLEPIAPPIATSNNLLENGDFEALNTSNLPTEWSKDCGGMWRILGAQRGSELYVAGGACIDQGLSAGDIATLAGKEFIYSCDAKNTGDSRRSPAYASISIFFDGIATSVEIPTYGVYQKIELRATAPTASNGFVSIYSEANLTIDNCSLSVAEATPVFEVVNETNSLTIDSDIFDIEGNTMVVGFPNDDTAGENTGKVAIYTKTQTEWVPSTEIVLADAVAGDGFGSVVKIKDDTLYIVARSAGISQLINRNLVYIYTKDTIGQWALRNTLADPLWRVPEGTFPRYCCFGETIVIDGNTLLLGSGYTAIGSRGTNKNIRIYSRDTDTSNDWQYVATSGAFSITSGALIDNDTLFLGGNYFSAAPYGSNPALVFGRNIGGENAWGKIQDISASNGLDYTQANRNLGSKFAKYQDTLIVNGSTGAFVFQLSDDVAEPWKSVGFLRNILPNLELPIAFSNETVIVGATQNKLLLNNGKYGDENFIYVLDISATDPQLWTVISTLKPSNLASGERIGFTAMNKAASEIDSETFGLLIYDATTNQPKRILTFDMP